MCFWQCGKAVEHPHSAANECAEPVCPAPRAHPRKLSYVQPWSSRGGCILAPEAPPARLLARM